MAKKTRAPPPAPSTPLKLPQISFPTVSPKEGLECNVLLDDQIILIDVRASSRNAIRTHSRTVPLPAKIVCRTSSLRWSAKHT